MDTRPWIGLLISLLLILAAGLGAWYWQENKINDLNQETARQDQRIERLEAQKDEDRPGVTYTSQKGVTVEVFLPSQGAEVSSPLVVLGRVPGNWSFEASFPVELRNADGDVVAEGAAELQGDWMTEELVPFVTAFEINGNLSGEGQLVLMKANPSDLGENDDSVSIPIVF